MEPLFFRQHFERRMYPPPPHYSVATLLNFDTQRPNTRFTASLLTQHPAKVYMLYLDDMSPTLSKYRRQTIALT